VHHCFKRISTRERKLAIRNDDDDDDDCARDICKEN